MPAPITNDVFSSYMPLVHQIAASISRRLPPNVQRDDLNAAGSYGLLQALSHGVQDHPAFEQYLRIRIRGAILDELRSQDWSPRRRRSKNPTTVVFGLDEVEATQPLLQPPPDEVVGASLRSQALINAIDKLPPREQAIINSHYFLGIRFKDMSQSLGVSEPRVSQLHSRAIGRLRAMLTPCEA